MDISLPVERMVQGKAVPLMLFISRVNHKSLSEIYEEIKTAKKQVIQDEADFVLNKGPSALLLKIFYALPQCFRMFFWNIILKNPLTAQKNMGSVIVSSVNIGGPHPGWMIPKSMHNLCLGLGSIVKKPWVVSNNIEIREILHLTLLFDHDVIDGAPAARFVSQLLRALEKADYLQ